MKRLFVLFVWAILARMTWLLASHTELWNNDAELRFGVIILLVLSLIWSLTIKLK